MDVDDVRKRARAASDRSMLAIGVIPLPALTNSSRSGNGSGSVKAPSTPPRRTIAPGRRRSHRKGETAPEGTSLGVIEMQPSARPGSEVSE